MLAGKLLAIGGKGTSNIQGAPKNEVYMYSASINSWNYISDLPDSQTSTAVAGHGLSLIEILVIGGLTTTAGLFSGLIATGGISGDRVSTVYKGILHLKP